MKRIFALILALTMMVTAAAFASAETTMPIVEEPITMTMMIGLDTSRGYDPADNAVFKYLEEVTNIHWDFIVVDRSSWTERLSLMWASGDMPDMIYNGVSGNDLLLYTGTLILDLKPYLEEYAPNFWNLYQNNADVRLAVDLPTGKIGSFVWTNMEIEAGAGQCPNEILYINQQWLDALGLEMPQTVDEYYETLMAFRDKDPNGNGEADEIPMIGSHNAWNGYFDEMIINYFTYYNTDYMLGVEDDVVYAPFVTEEWQEAMIYMNKLVSEGLLSDLSFTMTLDEMVSMIQSYPPEEQILGFIVGIPVHTFPDPSTTSILAYDAVPPFEDAYTPERTANVTKYAFITADCEHPEIAFRLFDYFAQERVSLITRYGEPGVHFMYRADDPEAFDAMFPNATQAAMSLGWEPIYAEMPGVVNPWVEESNAIWAVHMCCMLPAITYGSQGTTTPADEFVTSWQEGVERGDVQAHRDYLNANSLKWLGQLPEQLFVDPIYTLEEMDMYNNTINTVKEYVRECIAAFATGAMDPVNDWDAYLASLDAAGLQDWLDVAQAYWDRSHAA